MDHRVHSGTAAVNPRGGKKCLECPEGIKLLGSNTTLRIHTPYPLCLYRSCRPPAPDPRMKLRNSHAILIPIRLRQDYGLTSPGTDAPLAVPVHSEAVPVPVHEGLYPCT